MQFLAVAFAIILALMYELSSGQGINTAPAASPAPFPAPYDNENYCRSFVCNDPFIKTLDGTPCGCVRPLQVCLRLNICINEFFYLVINLTENLAVELFLKQSQVRITSTKVATHEPEKTDVFIDLVPLVEKFDNVTALLIFNRFWNKEISLEKKFHGYDVIYVNYPGLPSSPPTEPFDIADQNEFTLGLGNNVIAILILLVFSVVVIISPIAWFVIFRWRPLNASNDQPPQSSQISLVRQSGVTNNKFGSRPGSELESFAANIGSAKTFSYSELQKATSNFDASKIIGEKCFGCLYSGVLEDGTNVAVKVLKRDDHQGDQEFMAEVEILSRLHHRHLVKLIGICIEALNRCLIYELVPNGSVESHLHGRDKQRSSLDWATRVKIALGAARGLAYLHEDSNPRVVHRDFKSSNILLEDDFTPKISDFGLARTGLEVENELISPRIMGTFGYMAPEYAMTGLLLVKSDVYSYGVVLLELLTGRKPVDMSRPPGEENLVTWARQLLTSRDSLEALLDKSLEAVISSESVAKVAAIASLCVQPEVSVRPYMGEVVQALKLVCDECDDLKEVSNSACDAYSAITGSSSQFSIPLHGYHPTDNPNSDTDMDYEQSLFMSEPLHVSPTFLSSLPDISRRHSTSVPVTSRKGRIIGIKSMKREAVSGYKLV